VSGRFVARRSDARRQEDQKFVFSALIRIRENIVCLHDSRESRRIPKSRIASCKPSGRLQRAGPRETAHLPRRTTTRHPRYSVNGPGSGNGSPAARSFPRFACLISCSCASRKALPEGHARRCPIPSGAPRWLRVDQASIRSHAPSTTKRRAMPHEELRELDPRPGARFCNSCGAGLELTCPSFRHSNPAGSLVCNCGYARFRAPRCAS